MNVDELRRTARRLREKLDFFEHKDAAAAMLYSQLAPLLTAAERGTITKNIEPRDIPGHRLFDDTILGDYTELNSAYTNFCFELIGAREWEAYKLLQERMADNVRDDAGTSE